MEEKPKRGRPRKLPIAENDSILSEQPGALRMSDNKLLTVNEVRNSLTELFSQALGSRNYNIVDGWGQYNPFLQNSRLKSLSTYPITYTPEQINSFLKEPQYNELALRSAGAGLAATQHLYYKILREAADIPMFLNYVVPPVLSEEQYNTKKFQEEEEFVDKWIQAFDIPNTLKRTALEVKREGKVTYVFRQCIEETPKGKKKVKYVTWQKLPPTFTKLTAIGEHGYIASFNLLIFLNPAYSPSQYPEFIRNIWEDLQQNGIVGYKDKRKNKLSVLDINKLNNYRYTFEGQSVQGIFESSKDSYMYWVQLPQDLCFTFASDSSNAWVAPDTMGLFNALQELTDYTVLAGLVASTPLTAILTGQAETVNNAQPGQDQTVISPHTLIAFQNAFNTIASSNVQAFFGPLKDLKLQSLPNIPNASDIKTKAVQNFISVAGEGGIITSADKPSVAMIKGAQALTASQYDFVTRQFETILNMLLNTWTGLEYEWKVCIWGDIYSYDTSVKTLKDLLYSGATFVLPQLASAYRLNMRQVRGIGTYIKANGIYDLFRPLSSTNAQQSTSTVGRPAIDDNEVVNDNTAASKDAGNNVSENKTYIAGQCLICGDTTEENHLLCPSCEEKYDWEEESEQNE